MVMKKIKIEQVRKGIFSNKKQKLKIKNLNFVGDRCSDFVLNYTLYMQRKYSIFWPFLDSLKKYLKKNKLRKNGRRHYKKENVKIYGIKPKNHFWKFVIKFVMILCGINLYSDNESNHRPRKSVKCTSARTPFVFKLKFSASLHSFFCFYQLESSQIQS